MYILIYNVYPRLASLFSTFIQELHIHLEHIKFAPESYVYLKYVTIITKSHIFLKHITCIPELHECLDTLHLFKNCKFIWNTLALPENYSLLKYQHKAHQKSSVVLYHVSQAERFSNNQEMTSMSIHI